MSFLSPITALIAAGLTLPPLVAMYFLKLRRKKVTVASTLLWRKAIQDMQVNAPFQKMRRNLLLLIQLLLLAALLLALARPTRQTMAQPGHQAVIIIDRSASMNATDAQGRTRLEDAKRQALKLIDTLTAPPPGSSPGSPGVSGRAGGTSGGGGVMVVSFAERAQVEQPFTGDPALLRAAIRRITATDQRSNIDQALRLVEPFAAQGEADASQALTVHVLSDGRVHPAADGSLALRGAKLAYRYVGADDAAHHADNLAIVSFSARRDFEKPQKVQVFARVTNYSDQPVSTNLTLSINGVPARVTPITVPPVGPAQRAADTPPGLEGAEGAGVAGGPGGPGGPGSQSVQFDLVLTDAALLALSHDHADALTTDNTAWLTLAPARRLRVLLVSEGNAFLDRVIRSAKVRDLVFMRPDKYEDQNPALLRRGGWDTASTGGGVSGEGFDVIIFDDYAPEQVPQVNSLYLGAAPPIEGLTRHSSPADGPANQRFFDWARDHALMRYVVLDDVLLARPGRLVLPPNGTVLATGQHGPLIGRLNRDGVEHVMTSFPVLQSDWPLYVSFPVFISNALQVLGLGSLADEAGIAYPVGRPAMIRVDQDIASLGYRGPEPILAQVRDGRAVLPPFERVGVYKTTGPVQPPDDRLAVNLLDPIESDLRVAPTLAVGSVTAQGASAQSSIAIEVWHWFVWGALAVLMIEWIVYTRRMHL